MTGADWKDLEAAWQSLPDESVPEAARRELRRAAHLQWWSKTYFVLEILCTVVSIAAGVWFLAYGDMLSVTLGIGIIILATIAMGASLWARAQPKPRDEDPVFLAIATASARVEFGLRMAMANLWVICFSMLFITLYAISIDIMGSDADKRAGYLAITIALGYAAVWLAGTLVYITWRQRDLKRLRAVEQSLKDN
jgi:predicted permease